MDSATLDTGLKFDRPPVARDRFRLVDADAHIDPPHTFWAEYLPPHLKDMAPTIEEGDECDFVVFEGRKRPLVMLANQAGRSGKDFKMMGKLSDLHDSASPEKRLATWMSTESTRRSCLAAARWGR